MNLRLSIPICTALTTCSLPSTNALRRLVSTLPVPARCLARSQPPHRMNLLLSILGQPTASPRLQASTLPATIAKHTGCTHPLVSSLITSLPRRGYEFVTRKITSHVASIKKGLRKDLVLGNLEAQRDWGHARDYVKAMWLMLQQDSGEDYVISTGENHSVREFCEIAFNQVGLNYRDYVRTDPKLVRPTEDTPLRGNS